MVDKARVLEIAKRKTMLSGYVDYKDFIELRPLDDVTSFWLKPIKTSLLENGYQCHEKNHNDQWWGKCGYTKKRTHFHRALL